MIVMQDENKFYEALGLRLRLRRQSLKISQGDLGKKLGVSGQQLQKYENGKNKIGLQKLLLCSQLMDVPLSYFLQISEEELNEPPSVAQRAMRIAFEMQTLPDDVQNSLQIFIRSLKKTKALSAV